MSISLKQASTALPFILRHSAQMIERHQMPLDVSGQDVYAVHDGISFTDEETRQEFYALVYVRISESQENIAEAKKILPPVQY